MSDAPRRSRSIEPNPPWTALRLRDRIGPGVAVLFVGINPGVRSALTGHHFAGYSNRFWRLLWEATLIPEPISSLEDQRLMEWGYGITNLIARPSPGIDDLRPAEYVEGWRLLERKIARFKPAIVALVGVTLYRAILPLLPPGRPDRAVRVTGRVRPAVGPQPLTVHGARIFVLPNPSGRNANFTYAEMLEAFRGLKRAIAVERRRRGGALGRERR